MKKSTTTTLNVLCAYRSERKPRPKGMRRQMGTLDNNTRPGTASATHRSCGPLLARFSVRHPRSIASFLSSALLSCLALCDEKTAVVLYIYGMAGGKWNLIIFSYFLAYFLELKTKSKVYHQEWYISRRNSAHDTKTGKKQTLSPSNNFTKIIFFFTTENKKLMSSGGVGFLIRTFPVPGSHY